MTKTDNNNEVKQSESPDSSILRYLEVDQQLDQQVTVVYHDKYILQQDLTPIRVCRSSLIWPPFLILLLFPPKML